MHNSILSILFAIFSAFFKYEYCGLMLFCFAKSLTTMQLDDFVTKICKIATKFSYLVAKLQLDFFVNFKPWIHIISKATTTYFFILQKVVHTLFVSKKGNCSTPVIAITNILKQWIVLKPRSDWLLKP